MVAFNNSSYMGYVTQAELMEGVDYKCKRASFFLCQISPVCDFQHIPAAV